MKTEGKYLRGNILDLDSQKNWHPTVHVILVPPHNNSISLPNESQRYAVPQPVFHLKHEKPHLNILYFKTQRIVLILVHVLLRAEKAYFGGEEGGEYGNRYVFGSGFLGLIVDEMQRLGDIAHPLLGVTRACAEVAHHEPSEVVFGLSVQGDELGASLQAGNGAEVAAADFGTRWVHSEKAASGVLHCHFGLQLLQLLACDAGRLVPH